MDCISVRFLAVILYHIYARYYHWKKLGKKIYDLSFFLKAIKPFFLKKNVNERSDWREHRGER